MAVVECKRKATTLEAIQFDGSPEALAEIKTWCLHDVFENPPRVSTGVGNYVVNPGAWVVAENGDYTVVSNEEFSEQFDTV